MWSPAVVCRGKETADGVADRGAPAAEAAARAEADRLRTRDPPDDPLAAIMRQLPQDHYSLREEHQARAHPAPVTGADGITRIRLETGHGRLLATLFGRVNVTRCAWRKPGAPNYSPADAALSLPAGRHSRTLDIPDYATDDLPDATAAFKAAFGAGD